MKFNVAQLLKSSSGASLQSYDLNEDITWIDDDLEILAPLVGRITLTRTVSGVLVAGHASTTMRMACPRCLEAYERNVSFEFEEEFVSAVDIRTGASLPMPEDVDPGLVIDEYHILDLAEPVRQYLVIAQTTCPPCKADCAGLCPECGQNLNLGQCQCSETVTDERFAALKALL